MTNRISRKMAQIPKPYFGNDTASSNQNSTSLFVDLGRDICAYYPHFGLRYISNDGTVSIEVSLIWSCNFIEILPVRASEIFFSALVTFS